MQVNVTVPQEVVHNFLERYSKWDGDEDTTPYLYLSSHDTGFEAQAYPLADDAILVGVPLQNFLVAMTKPNDKPYEVWFTLIRNSEGVWEQGPRTKVFTFDESMAFEESQNYRGLLEELRG